MKFRVLAGTVAMAMLLSATACGTGNMANNAYGVNRTNHSVARERVGNVNRGVVNRNYTGRHHVGANYAGRNHLGSSTTGRAMNDYGYGTTGMRSHTGGRLGNALHNTRNTAYNGVERTGGVMNRGAGYVNHSRAGRLTNNIGRTSTGRINDGVNINFDGTAYDGTPNGVITPRGTDGRVVQNRTAQNRTAQNRTTRGRTTGAYRNSNNFQNTVYRDNQVSTQSNRAGSTNAGRTAVNRNTVNRNAVNRGATQRLDGANLANNVNRAVNNVNNVNRNETQSNRSVNRVNRTNRTVNRTNRTANQVNRNVNQVNFNNRSNEFGIDNNVNRNAVNYNYNGLQNTGVQNSVQNNTARSTDLQGGSISQNDFAYNNIAYNNSSSSIAQNNGSQYDQTLASRNNGRTLVDNALDNQGQRMSHNGFNWDNNNTNQIHKNGNARRYEGAVHPMNQNGYNLANNARQLRGDISHRGETARNGYLISDSSVYDGSYIVGDGNYTIRDGSMMQHNSAMQNVPSHNVTHTQNRNTGRTENGTTGTTNRTSSGITAHDGNATTRTTNRGTNRPVNRTAAASHGTTRTITR